MVAVPLAGQALLARSPGYGGTMPGMTAKVVLRGRNQEAYRRWIANRDDCITAHDLDNLMANAMMPTLNTVKALLRRAAGCFSRSTPPSFFPSPRRGQRPGVGVERSLTPPCQTVGSKRAGGPSNQKCRGPRSPSAAQRSRSVQDVAAGERSQPRLVAWGSASAYTLRDSLFIIGRVQPAIAKAAALPLLLLLRASSWSRRRRGSSGDMPAEAGVRESHLDRMSETLVLLEFLESCLSQCCVSQCFLRFRLAVAGILRPLHRVIGVRWCLRRLLGCWLSDPGRVVRRDVDAVHEQADALRASEPRSLSDIRPLA